MIILFFLKNICCCYSYVIVYIMYLVFFLVFDKDVFAEIVMIYLELYKELVKVICFLKEVCYRNMRFELRYIFYENLRVLEI